MDKNAIKKYAVWARTELITRVSQRAEKYDITAEADANASSVNGVLLSDAEKKQRKALIEQVKQKGYEQVMEEVAYTWFNRFIALRFMEVNGYLPSHIRVFTDDNNEFKPQILAEAIHLELDGLDMEKVYEMKNNNENDELYKYLIITQCNDLSKILPGMFQKISDYTELLFPDNILRDESVIEQMITLIPENDWKDQVQIVGWLYQYYNTEPKDKVFAGLKKNVKITKENIPAATQLFTPDWIVRYMVENSLGRLWVEGHPQNTIKSEWKYFLEEAEQESNVQESLEELRKDYATLKPEEILCIDPCSGSGHILAYMFDVLIQIYEDYGISTRDAVKSIILNNIWGLDIDNRAAQLAYFSVMMKGVQYDRRFLQRKDENGNPYVPQPHVFAIRESNDLDELAVEYFCNNDVALKKDMDILISELHDAKEYGSIINVSQVDFDALFRRFDECKNEISISNFAVERQIYPFIQVAKALAQKYHAVVTNPPYMGGSGMSPKLSSFVKKMYPNTKSDMSTVFMEKTLALCSELGFMSMINIPVWMFLSSYESLRKQILSSRQFVSLMHMGRGVFGADFGTTTFVIRAYKIPRYISSFRKLYERQGSVDDIEKKLLLFNSGYGKYFIQQDRFMNVPGHCIAYSASDNLLNDFETGKRFDEIADAKQGLATADNARFLRLWQEVDINAICFNCESHEEAKESGKKWFPYNKGGGYCKWYGNNSYTINWENDGKELSEFKGSVIRSPQYYFRDCLSWCKVTISGFSMRYIPKGFLFDVAGCSLFTGKDDELYILGFANSNVNSTILSILSPTVNYEVGQISSLPLIESNNDKEIVEKLVAENVSFCKHEWDAFENSWEFKKHPLINGEKSIQESYEIFKEERNRVFNKVKDNEEEINRIFIRIYGLEEELTPDVLMRDITIHYVVNSRDDIPEELEGSAYILTKEDVVKSFVSYAVGCMFGRYSLDEEGLIYAGGIWDASRYKKFYVDKDAILPICDDEYFDDDITGLFVKFVATVYGKDNLEKNLQFIADALGICGTPREAIRSYFINNFYSDHCITYSVAGSGKRPIYWLFDSGKKNGFKCLVYMHRYQPDTIARIRTDYVHEQQARYRTAIEETENRLLSANGSDKVKLGRKLNKLREQDIEIHEYEEKIHHLADQMISIELDDGVKVNYAKFQDVLAKIK